MKTVRITGEQYSHLVIIIQGAAGKSIGIGTGIYAVDLPLINRIITPVYDRCCESDINPAANGSSRGTDCNGRDQVITKTIGIIKTNRTPIRRTETTSIDMRSVLQHSLPTLCNSKWRLQAHRAGVKVAAHGYQLKME